MFNAVNKYKFSKAYGDGSITTKVDRLSLYSGFEDNKPCYQIDSGFIPVTGTFTGYPIATFITWLESIGYQYHGRESMKCNSNQVKYYGN